MKVLLVYNLYNPRKPKIACYDMKLRGSFECAYPNGEHTYEVLHYGFEPGYAPDTKTLNEEILKRDFDICVVAEELQFHITLDTAKKLGKKLFLIVWDLWVAISTNDEINFRIASKQPRTWGEHYNPHSIVELSEYCNLVVTGFGIDEIMPNVYGLLNTVDTRIFYPDFESEQNIDVSHNGTIYIPERIKYFEIFRKANINISYTGNNPGLNPDARYLSDEEYADIYRKSKISLCYTETVFGPNHKEKKGRIGEIGACGGFMLMTHPEIFKYRGKNLFTEGVHYDTIDESDCVDKVRFYLDNPSKRIEMAKAFYEEWEKTHSPKVYWDKIIAWSGQENK